MSLLPCPWLTFKLRPLTVHYNGRNGNNVVDRFQGEHENRFFSATTLANG